MQNYHHLAESHSVTCSVLIEHSHNFQRQYTTYGLNIDISLLEG